MIATVKQEKLIDFIELYTEHRFTGFNVEQADDFISRYLQEATSIKNKPTERQIKTARNICKRKNIKCHAKTKREFWLFINEHMGNYIR